jgi:Regulator of chromosome condensation (RCC1) repeat
VGRVSIALPLLLACTKHGEPPPPSPLQDGAVVAVLADAAVASIDAAVPREAPTAKKIVVGGRAACAVMSDATVRCWGGNANGQLGNGTLQSSATPVAPAIRGVIDLVLNDDLVCGLIDDSSVMCWGKLGFGKTVGMSSPVAVPGVRGIVRIFAVDGAACGTDKGGALVCWGSVDARGHVIANGSHAPTPVGGIDHVVALSSHAAVRDNGDVWTWIDGGAPKPAGLAHATELAERDVPCALADGAVTCFADKPLCGAAISLTEKPVDKPKKPKKPKPKPKAKKPEPPPAPSSVAFALPTGKVSHLAFATGTCVQSATKRLDCVDLDHGCKVERPWPALVTVEQISGACARLTNGTVRCGATATPAAPVIAGVANAIAISATATRGCALAKDHAVLCWEGTSPARVIEF